MRYIRTIIFTLNLHVTDKGSIRYKINTLNYIRIFTR